MLANPTSPGKMTKISINWLRIFSPQTTVRDYRLVYYPGLSSGMKTGESSTAISSTVCQILETLDHGH